MKVKLGSRVRQVARVETLLPVGAVLGEVLRLFPWMVLLASLGFFGFDTPPLGVLSALAIVAVTVFAVRWALGSGWSLGNVRLLTISVSVALLLVLIRLENSGGYGFWDIAWGNYAVDQLPALGSALGFGLVLIWRGVTVGREPLNVDYLYRNFVIGIVGFVVLMLAWALTSNFHHGQNLFASVVPYVLSYFFVALMTLGVSNFLSLREGSRTRPKAVDLFARRWLLVLLGVVLVVILVGAIIGSTVSFDLTGAVTRAAGVLGDWLLTAAKYVIGYPLGWLATVIYWVANWLINLFRGSARPMEGQGDPGEVPDDLKQFNMDSLPPGLLLAIKWVLVALAVALVVYILARLITRYWRGTQEKGFEEVHESLWSWTGFRADLKSFLKGMLRRRGEGRVAPAPPIACTIEGEEQYLDIRELYRGLLWEGEQVGHPKAKSQTPYEYQRALAGFFPDEHEDLAEITGTYVENRYGHVPVGSALGQRLMRVWLKLRAALRLSAGGGQPSGNAASK